MAIQVDIQKLNIIHQNYFSSYFAICIINLVVGYIVKPQS